MWYRITFLLLILFALIAFATTGLTFAAYKDTMDGSYYPSSLTTTNYVESITVTNGVPHW